MVVTTKLFNQVLQMKKILVKVKLTNKLKSYKASLMSIKKLSLS